MIIMIIIIKNTSDQYLGRFFDIVSRDPSVSKSNWFHVDIFQNFFIKWGYILWIPHKRSTVFLKFEISTGYFSN